MARSRRTALVTVSAITVFTAFNVSALNAPYLSSATTTSGHSITLTWRNNDFAATKVIILRKTATTAWNFRDSVSGTTTTYTDSSLMPLTAYSFALLAAAPGLMSDTSNVLTTTTPKTAFVFVDPRINVSWVEGQKYITVNFFDSSNTEKGFRLFRKSLTDSWAAIDSMVSKAPDTVAWKSFTDKAIADNTWYTYKVQVYNDSQTAFSPETTVYNYVRPKQTKSYTITKKGSIPAKPISWVERIGDSLYFPEIAAPGDTEISVVDVANSLSPQFRGYVSMKNIPGWLKGSVVEARVRIVSDGIFEHRNGYYVVSRQGTLYQFDSTGFYVRDSIYCGKFSPWLIGWLNDSLCLIGAPIAGGTKNVVYCAQPIHLGISSIDTFPSSIRWTDDRPGFGPAVYGVWKCFNNRAIFSNSFYYDSYSNSNSYSYMFYDYSTGNELPFTFNKKVSDTLFGNVQSPIFDTGMAFTTITATKGIALYAFNIADAHSGPGQSYLGKLDDSNFTCGSLKEIQLDTKKHYAYLIGDSGISIYSYSVGPAGVYTPSLSRNAAIKRLAVLQTSRGVCFNIIGAKMQSLQVLNVKGQVVRSAAVSTGDSFFWDRRDNAGKIAPAGFYIYKIGTLKDGVMAGSVVLGR
jgi:hypothetical protein